MEISNPEYLAGGLQAAAKVVDVETSSMSAEEKKRFESITVRKRSYGSQYGSQYGNAAANGAAQQPKSDSLKNDLLKLLVGASEVVQSAITARKWVISLKIAASPPGPNLK